MLRELIALARAWVRGHGPRLRLRTILFATLFLVAALPGFGAVFLRVYENTLVRQTESELVAQGAALAAAAAVLWPGAPSAIDPGVFRAEPPRIDLNATPILPERPAPVADKPLSPAFVAAGMRIAPVVRRTQRTTMAGILLLDERGRSEAGSLAALPEVHAASRGQPATVIRRNGAYRAVYRFEWLSRAAAIRVHHARPVIVGDRVVAVLLLSRSARSLFRGIYEDRGKIAVGVLVIFTLLVVLTTLLSRGIVRPIEALGAATNAVAAGRGTVPAVPATAAVEIQALYRDFAAMADAIDRRSRYLRDFAHAVSHEFKTPLAGIRGALELLHDHDATMTPADRRRFLANADADADRLVLLVTRLLELARADMTAAESETPAALAPILHALADALHVPGFRIAIEDAGSLPPVAVPPASIERALTAILDNSRKSGAANVTVTAVSSFRSVTLTLADDGPGIAPADRARVFEPFFTTRRVAGGSGLGLPIVRSLLESAGAEVTLADQGVGATFVLTLPVA